MPCKCRLAVTGSTPPSFPKSPQKSSPSGQGHPSSVPLTALPLSFLRHLLYLLSPLCIFHSSVQFHEFHPHGPLTDTIVPPSPHKPSRHPHPLPKALSPQCLLTFMVIALNLFLTRVPGSLPVNSGSPACTHPPPKPHCQSRLPLFHHFLPWHPGTALATMP